MIQLDWVETVEELRQNVLTFARAMATGDDRTAWAAPHVGYYVYDPQNSAFAPAKFAAFREMTIERYAELQQLQREGKSPGRFDGSAARRCVSKVLGGREFLEDKDLATALRAAVAAGHGEDAVGTFDSANRYFISLPPSIALWWVNQGKTHKEEIGGGFVWAPQKSTTGQTYYHWKNVASIKKGDVIFHYFDSAIRGVSVATNNGAPASCPPSIAGNAWESQGWLAPVTVTTLEDPLPLAAFARELQQLEIDGGPIAADGSVKQGYLFSLPHDAGALLLKKLPDHILPAALNDAIAGLKQIQPKRKNGDAGNHGTLNRVLYGPPGTGKTYLATRLAVEICDGALPATSEAVARRYAELQDAGRIRFVTFHQSYGYEEFVEGLRPVLRSEGDTADTSQDLLYECRPGLFRRLCDAAQNVKTSVRGGFQIEPSRQRIWKMSLGNTLDPEEQGIYADCVEGNYLWLGYGRGLDFTGCDSRAAVLERLRTVDPNTAPNDYHATSVNLFKNKMAIGDVVLVSEGNYKFRAIGRVTGDYRPPEDPEDGQRRDVEWLVTLEPSLSFERILNNIFSQASIYRLRPEVLKLDALNALLAGPADPTPDNYVLIIDEINRGNISKILGELITLLEPDKRLGGSNELRVRLPYSQEEFGVPGNLYLVGTMNTADRSIAFLDTALRRRFEFIEIMPESSVIREHVGTNGVIEGIDLAALCDEMNRRIELLYDRDHTIGHAYFLGVKTLTDLRDLLAKKLIPLLQEYFYGDWHKLSQVLGCPFNPDDGQLARPNEHPMLTTTVLDPEKLLAGSDGTVDLRIRCEVNPRFLEADKTTLAAFFAPLLPTGP